ncbi:hypothetical protein KBC99_02070 [Candidatus Saccharibacteria bacterium]|nr:hypothetical protein [Candidatus Saccharibacteria bacterium]
MLSPTEIRAIADEVRRQRDITEEINATIATLKAERDTASRVAYKGKTRYYESRAAYILQLLAEVDKAYCPWCKRVRPASQMRIMHESGITWKSDCSYSEWCEHWERDLLICMKCAAVMEFTMSINQGRKVGRELRNFDRTTHDSILLREIEIHDEINLAMQLGLPAL